jgi:hypothetical protein
MQGQDHTYNDRCPIQVLGLVQTLVFFERVNGDIGLLKTLEISKTLQQGG